MSNETYVGYCFHCRKKQEIKDPEKIIMKNRMNAVKGICTVCGGKIFKILPKS